MHSRRSQQVGILIQRRSTRFVSTGSALKLAPRNLGKWAKPQETPPKSQVLSSRTTDSQRAGPSYRPNTEKWAPQEPIRAPRRSILDNLDVSTRNSRHSKPFTKRGDSRVRDSTFSQRAPMFPTYPAPQGLARDRESMDPESSRSGKLEKEPPPHLVMSREVQSSNHKPTRTPSLGEISRQDSQQQPQDSEASTAPKANKPLQAEYFENYAPETNLIDEKYDNKRVKRGAHKNRGSVINRLSADEQIEIPSHSRTHQERLEHERKAKKQPKEVKPINLDVSIPSISSVENLSRILGIRLETLQGCMQRNGMEEQSSHDHMLSADDASLLAMEFNRNPIVDDEAAFDIYASPPHPDAASLPRRPPVVTIMGHVDHGKTTLLDTLHSSSVAKGEAGGITQHIGAFSVPVPSEARLEDTPHTITFLDTPGHAAFSAMRARGAQVTDIIVLVVAADDGVMPQTKEVVDLIKKEKGKVGVVVAINKVDKPEADVGKVQSALWAEGIELEAMGGDVPSVEVSGLTGHGLDELVETISLLAELQDIRSEAEGPAHGYVLESKVQKGLGNTATVLLLRGKLTPSSHIICGTTYAKIRRLMDSSGRTVKAAAPGSAVVVSGWKELPCAGDEVLQGKEDDVKRAVDNRKRRASLEATLADAEAINSARRQDREERERKLKEASGEVEQTDIPVSTKEAGPKELRLIIKGDVSGSVEALAAAVEGIGNKDAVTKVVSSGVGEVTESDVMLAKAVEGMIIAFSVNVPRAADQAASRNEVPIYSSNIIYRVLDEVKERLVTLLPCIIEKRVSGEANVLQIFDINAKAKSIIKVAGCRVSNGVIEKNKRVRVLRDGNVIHEGTLSTLRILKRDVMEVKKGLECGINITNFSDLRAGDFLQFYHEIEKPGQL